MTNTEKRQIIEKQIREDGYFPEKDMETLIENVLVLFDNKDNYGEYDPQTLCGGFGEEFSKDGLCDFVAASGGWWMFEAC